MNYGYDTVNNPHQPTSTSVHSGCPLVTGDVEDLPRQIIFSTSLNKQGREATAACMRGRRRREEVRRPKSRRQHR